MMPQYVGGVGLPLHCPRWEFILPIRPPGLRAARTVRASALLATRPLARKMRLFIFAGSLTFSKAVTFWCQTINGVVLCTAGTHLRSPCPAAMAGHRGRGREGSPLLAQAGAVPGMGELLLGSPRVLCPQPALGALTQPMGRCRATAQRHQGWVTVPSPGCPLHLWLSGCQGPGKSHAKSLLSMRRRPPAQRTGTSLCPPATLLCVTCGFPVSLWGACSLHLPPSIGYGGMGTFSVHPCMCHPAAWHR